MFRKNTYEIFIPSIYRDGTIELKPIPPEIKTFRNPMRKFDAYEGCIKHHLARSIKKLTKIRRINKRRRAKRCWSKKKKQRW